jgi:DNA-binding response OmpR family regulator
MVQKILIIEDDTSIIQQYKMKFEEAGYEVVEATTGISGIELAKSEHPDLILLDVIIPQNDGFAVLKNLKEDSSTKDIPIILLTNLAQEGDRKRGLKLGAKEYLVKANFTPSEVLHKTEEHLKK